jgi:Domain of unknown function (DUF4340)
MKLKPITVVLVLVAAILGGVVYFSQVQTSSQPNTSEEGGQRIFDFQENQVQSFTLKNPLRSLAFQKDNEGIWQMQEPEQSLANDASVAYLLNLMAIGRSDRTLTAPAADKAQFGLHQPFATIKVTLGNQETHTLILGEYDFNRSAIYAQADPPIDDTEEIKVLLVSPDFETACNRPLSEWKQSPSEEATTPASPETGGGEDGK